MKIDTDIGIIALINLASSIITIVLGPSFKLTVEASTIIILSILLFSSIYIIIKQTIIIKTINQKLSDIHDKHSALAHEYKIKQNILNLYKKAWENISFLIITLKERNYAERATTLQEYHLKQTSELNKEENEQ